MPPKRGAPTKPYQPRRRDFAAGKGVYPDAPIPQDWRPVIGEDDDLRQTATVGYYAEQRVLAAVVLCGGQLKADFKGQMNSQLAHLSAGSLNTSVVSRALQQLAQKKIVHLDYVNPDKLRGRWVKGVYLLDGECQADKWAMDEARAWLEKRRAANPSKQKAVPDDYVPQRPNQPVPEVLEAPPLVPATEELASEQPEPVSTPEPEPEPGSLSALADELLVRAGKALAARGVFEAQVADLKKRLNTSNQRNVESEVLVTQLRRRLSRLSSGKSSSDLQAKFDEAKRYAYDLEQERDSLRAQITQMDVNLTAVVEKCKEQHEELERFKARQRRDDENARREYKLREHLDPASRAALEALSKQGTVVTNTPPDTT